MTEVCWNGAAGPIEENSVSGNCWAALDRDGRDVLPDQAFYADDAAGEIWCFALRGGQAVMVNGEPLVVRARLGAGAFRLVRRE